MARISEENFILNKEAEHFQGTVQEVASGSKITETNLSLKGAHLLPPLFFSWLKNNNKKIPTSCRYFYKTS